MSVITIREEKVDDQAAIRLVNERAFPGPTEADLVDSLREHCPEGLSLVAEIEGRVVGHILFTPTRLEDGPDVPPGMGLAPMAVLPEHQRQGVGGRLIEAGMAALAQRACPYVIVLGHAEYYPRFGFVSASRHGVVCPWDGVGDEYFMIRILDESVTPRLGGVLRYRQEFDEAP